VTFLFSTFISQWFWQWKVCYAFPGHMFQRKPRAPRFTKWSSSAAPCHLWSSLHEPFGNGGVSSCFQPIQLSTTHSHPFIFL
jgi:hypothetical protein